MGVRDLGRIGRRPGSFDDYLSQDAHRLLRLAYLLTGNHHDAEDLVQDSLIKIHRHWRRVQAANSTSAYCRKVLLNQYLASKRRRTLPTTPLSQVEATSPTIPQDAVIEREALRRALLELPERQRAVIVLKHYGELDAAQIGDLLGITESSVRSALARGLESLRVTLKVQEAENNDAIR
jgi:RNA polymerase sigma-70 factor (sigma-E family)